MYQILKKELNSPTKFREKLKDYISKLVLLVQKRYKISFKDEEISELLLAACRSNDFNVLLQERNKIFLDEDRVLDWIDRKLIPNTVIVRIDDEDIIRLLIFCIEMTYQMFAGGTKATVTAKGFRERRRTFESILVDQFVGKLGETIVKKFLEHNFSSAKIELDWERSRQIEKFRNDIINARKKVSIKLSPTLSGVWGEADIGYDYGIMVKCSIPQPTILQFFIEVCGFSRLLEFAEERIPHYDKLFKNYLVEIKKRITGYKCGKIKTDKKGVLCGYFETSGLRTQKEGKYLDYLGLVREERYIVPIRELKWTKGIGRNF